MDKINRSCFIKKYLMGTVQPELFYLMWENGKLTIYLEKTDEFGNRMSNVELRIFSTNGVECYDTNYGTSPYRYDLLTKPCVLYDDGNGNFNCPKYNSHNFEKNPLTFKNADITEVKTYRTQFKPTNQPITISGLKAGNYIIDEVDVFDSEYLYDSNKSKIYITIDENGNLLNVKSLVISRNDYEYHGEDYYSELNLPNQTFEYFENSNVQNVLIVKQEWITHYYNNMCKLINYETLFRLHICHYVCLDHDLIGLNHISKITPTDITYQLTSDRDITQLKAYHNDNSPDVTIIDSHTVEITVNNNLDFYDNYQANHVLKDLRIADYEYHEISPPICYTYNGENIKCYKDDNNINFKIIKEDYGTLKTINVYHDYPTIKFVATWVSIPKAICTEYTYWDLTKNDNTQGIYAFGVNSINCGDTQFGIKIYIDDKYCGYFSFVRFLTNSYGEYIEPCIANNPIPLSCPIKDKLPDESQYIYLIPYFCKQYINENYSDPSDGYSQFNKYLKQTNAFSDLSMFNIYYASSFRFQFDYCQEMDIISRDLSSSTMDQYHEEINSTEGMPFNIEYIINEIDMEHLSPADIYNGLCCYLGDGLTKEKFQMILNMQCNTSSVYRDYRICEVEN